MFQVCRVTGLKCRSVVELHGYSVAGLQGYRLGLQCRSVVLIVAELHGYWLQCCRFAGLQVYIVAVL